MRISTPLPPPSRRFLNALPLAVLATVASACSNASPEVDASATGGQGGAGGTSPEGGTASLGYYPLVDGARWTYAHAPAIGDDCGAVSDCWEETLTLGTTTHEGRSAFVLLDDGSAPDGSRSEAVLATLGTMAVRVYKHVEIGGVPDEEVSYDPGFPRFDDEWLDAAKGTLVDTQYTRIETDLRAGKMGEMRTDLRMQQYEIEGFEDITVPAGSFDDCLKVRRLREATSTAAGAGSDEKEKRFWFCEGVGKVREDNLTGGGQEVLLSCDVPGGLCPR